MQSNPGPPHSDLTLTAEPAAAFHARRHTAEVLDKWGLAEVVDPAELVVSELVTNAVRATAAVLATMLPAEEATDRQAPIRLRLAQLDRRLLIEVWDSDDRPPAPRHTDAEAEGGRGLLLVEALSEGWGWRATPGGGKTVWCELGIGP